MGMFIEEPWLAIVPAAIFAWLFFTSRRFAPCVAAIVWILYGFYEYGMKVRWLCTGECNIRVDLLLMYPVLILISVAGVVSAVRGASSQASSGHRRSRGAR